MQGGGGNEEQRSYVIGGRRGSKDMTDTRKKSSLDKHSGACAQRLVS